ncbi:DUF3179 domain-containing (seleno)protein [Natronococcus occultus]|uniref:DUF3179 domain-containing (seleno)protein n=1 Tax=Natronococcus occultus TaxID=29288 RepID=UPI0006777CB2|nr:DUF3179 domain-containing (seleno)protein [Natronococcus occultus]
MNVRQVVPKDAIPSIDAPTFGPDHAGEPDGEVIVLEGSRPKAYPLRILPYHEIVNDTIADYFDGEGFGLAAHRGTDGERSWDREDLDPKTVVLGVAFEDEALGFPLPRVEDDGGVVHETVGGTDIVVLATDDGVHAFENPGYEFERTDDGQVRADGTTWDGVTGAAADGRELDRVPARRLFAFAWRDDHGADAFY